MSSGTAVDVGLNYDFPCALFIPCAASKLPRHAGCGNRAWDFGASLCHCVRRYITPPSIGGGHGAAVPLRGRHMGAVAS